MIKNRVLRIYQLFTGSAHSDIEACFAGKCYAKFKRELAEIIIENLQPLQSRYRALTAEADYLTRYLPRELVKFGLLQKKLWPWLETKSGSDEVTYRDTSIGYYGQAI